MKVKQFFYGWLLASLCVSTFAGTIEIKYVGIDAGGQQQVTGHSGRNGVMVMQTQNANGPLAEQLSEYIGTYCYELNQHASTSYKTYQVFSLTDAIGPDKAALIAQLWHQHYQDAWQSNTFISGSPANTQENTEALAFSFAIYEIIEDYAGSVGSLDLDSDDFQGFGSNPVAALTTAENWLSSLQPVDQYDGPLAQLISLSHQRKQDYITEIPEPATLALLGLGSILFRRGQQR